MEFDWSEQSIDAWRDYLTKLPSNNFLQSWTFAKAVRSLNYRPTRLAKILKDGNLVGIMAVQEIKIGPVSIVNLYRGPLWFTPNPQQELLAEFACAFDQTFPKSLFRRRRWMPEWTHDPAAEAILEKAGFTKKEEKDYKTILLDLTQSKQSLRGQLKQKWRNALNKAERADLSLREDWRGVTAPLFIANYLEHKESKGYRGPSEKFLREELKAAFPLGDAVIFWASKNKKPLAAILIFLHGNAATYHAGWTTPDGRIVNAHNLLLWKAIETLKEKSVGTLDLGWIDELTGEGLTQFKRGLGGTQYNLLGVWG
jgi:lipid II:glycine glycyltransferase (peptidoglycan interpeptide bridge formation enzyme)